MLTGWARGLGEPCAGPWTGLCGAASQYDPPWGAMPLVHRSGDAAVTGDHVTSAPQAMPRGGCHLGTAPRNAPGGDPAMGGMGVHGPRTEPPGGDPGS